MVGIMSSGFLVSQLATPHVEPLTFLLLRYAAVLVLMLALALAARAAWPRGRQLLHVAVSGTGIHAGYLGGMWLAVAGGMPSSVVALVTNLQPVLTGIALAAVGARVSARAATGLVIGFGGVALVVAARLSTDGVTASGIGLAVLALLSVTAGTLYQKALCPAFDLRTGQVVQSAACIAVTAPFAITSESFHVEWTVTVASALMWAVGVNTVAGMSILYGMLRRGSAERVTSYFYLTPAVTTVLAAVLFGEPIAPVTALGIVVTMAGVVLVTARPAGERPGGAPSGQDAQTAAVPVEA
ncbi:DMT family transporter [Pseudonocardia adelaidensis]